MKKEYAFLLIILSSLFLFSVWDPPQYRGADIIFCIYNYSDQAIYWQYSCGDELPIDQPVQLFYLGWRNFFDIKSQTHKIDSTQSIITTSNRRIDAFVKAEEHMYVDEWNYFLDDCGSQTIKFLFHCRRNNASKKLGKKFVKGSYIKRK